MVKIYLQNATIIENLYLVYVKSGLSLRITAMQTALSDLSGRTINTRSIGHEISRGFAEKIVNHLETKPPYKPEEYNLIPYSATIIGYRSGINSFTAQVFSNASKLFSSLLANGEKLLAELLVCQPGKLEAINTQLDWGKFNSFEIFLIKLIFNSKTQKKYWETIRDFFKNHVPVNICPYCNYDLVEHISSINGSAYTSSLDHFYSQSSFPLLCYSFYNLIPSDTNCNSFKKHEKEFCDQYHLHPYVYDFGQLANFKATYLPPFKQLDDIELVLNVKSGKMYDRMMGDVNVYTPGHKNGNINVFKINELYKGGDFKKSAKYTLDALRNMTGTLINISKLMGMFVLSEERQKKVYKNWYNKKLRSSFSKTEFTNDRLAKLNRDLHDAHISKSPLLNYNILKLIQEDNNLS